MQAMAACNVRLFGNERPARRTSAAGGLRRQGPARQRVWAVAAAAPTARAEDKFVARSLDVLTPAAVPAPLANLHSSCTTAALSLRVPTTRNEDYRFTDVTPLTQAQLARPAPADASAVAAAVAAHTLKEQPAATVVVVDGVVSQQHSSASALPAGAYAGGLAGAPAAVVSMALGAQSRGRGGPFATLNGAAVADAVVVHVPANTTVTQPIHVLYLSSGPSAVGSAEVPASAPRLLAVVEEGATAELVEEFVSLAGDDPGAVPAAATAFCNAVAELELDDGAALKHSYVQAQGRGAFHLRATLVNQGKESSYSLTEVALGGTLARHDLGIDQLGEATQSTMRSFLVCGDGQLQDLHSKLRLDHPLGEASQLHKCIVSHATGRGVFDGNVRVNRLAQKTDAQQLSRNLLLVPRATVNVKPNLQIIADDVKCTHGCTVSDLEEEELFYLRARGISTTMARQLLVYSFGQEVVQGLRDELLLQRVEAAVRATLASASF